MPGNNERKQHHGLFQQKHNEESDNLPLLRACYITPEILHTVLDSPIQEIHWYIGEEGYQDAQRSGALVLEGEAREMVLVQPREETAFGEPN